MELSLFFAILSSSLCAYGEVSLPEIAARLRESDRWQSAARYEVIMPNADEPVTYTLNLICEPAPGDSLSPCNYLIESFFSTYGSDNVSEGFSAYFSGNYYRFRNGKLLEFHADDDPKPFAPRGLAKGGAQMNDQFAPMLPPFMADKISLMASDSAYEYMIERHGDEIVVKGRENRGEYVANEFSYRFDNKTYMPTLWEMTTNPGQLGEQTITAQYMPGTETCPMLSEGVLIKRHSDVFAKYRRDSFSLENLHGEPLPGFTAPTSGHRRYVHNRGDAFEAPTIIAVLDSKVDATADVIGTVRNAMASLPSVCNLIIAFVDNDRDAAGELTDPILPGETVLVSARELAANCGVADTPSIIFCRVDGTVSDIHVGRNNNLREIVIQKAAMCR